MATAERLSYETAEAGDAFRVPLSRPLAPDSNAGAPAGHPGQYLAWSRTITGSPHPLKVERPGSPNGSSRSRTAFTGPTSRIRRAKA